MVLHEREQCLIAVSGDGTLTVNDLRTGKVQTPPLHELLSAVECIFLLTSILFALSLWTRTDLMLARTS